MESDMISRSKATSNLMKQPKLTKSIVRRVLIQTPSADVVEVVRCKDCMWSRVADVDREPKYRCVHLSRYGCGQWLDSNDFCSYGERKNSNE